MKQIVTTPNNVLTQPCNPIEKVDKNIKRILTEMEVALISAKDPKGVGLASPQIGYSLQIFCIKPNDSAKVTFFLNPKIINLSEEEINLPEKNTPLEGCLSIPNAWGVVHRKKTVTLSYLNEKGKPLTKTFSGFPAVIIQHEMDHLSGILFTARILEQEGKLYEIITDKEGKETLKELPL